MIRIWQATARAAKGQRALRFLDPPQGLKNTRRRTWWRQASWVVKGLVLATICICVGAVVESLPSRRSALADETEIAPEDFWALAAIAAFIGCCFAAREVGRRAAVARGEVLPDGRPRLTFWTFVNPWLTSRFIFLPKGIYGIEDRTTRRITLARSLLAIIITAGVVATHNPLSFGALSSHFVLQALVILQQALINLVLATLVLIGVGVAMLAATAAVERPTASRALRRPIPALGAAWLTVALLLLVVSFAPDSGQLFPDWGLADPWLAMATFFYALVVIWIMAFAGFSLVFVLRNVFNSADAHPQLPSTAAPLIAWASIVLPMIGSALLRDEPGSGGGFLQLPLPSVVALYLSLGGAVTITVISGWDLVRLRRQGVKIRSGWL